MIVHRAVAARHALEPVVEVVDDFCERHFVLQNLARLADHLLRKEDATTTFSELHEVADVFVRANDVDLHDRFTDIEDDRSIGQIGGIMNLDRGAIREVNHVRHRWRRLHDRHAAFALKALLHDVHVQQPKEATTETEAERFGVLRFKGETCIIQMELLDGDAELFEVRLLAEFVCA